MKFTTYQIFFFFFFFFFKGVQLKSHYDNFKGLIQLKSTPRVFYKPAKHNDVTRKLLEETQKQINGAFSFSE